MVVGPKNFPMLALVAINVLFFSSCNRDKANPKNDPKPSIDFGDPREVTIAGYSGDAMEPFISKDGNTLFFNNFNGDMLSNGGENDTNIHYATRIDDVTFVYKGEVTGANIDSIPNNNELEGVASMDRDGNFYFIRTIDYLDGNSTDYLKSIFMANYVNGDLGNIQSLPNLKMDRPHGEAPVPGELNFDAEIHADGDMLYFVEGIFSGSPLPDSADIGIAVQSGGSFVVNTNSKTIFSAVNTDALEYAPSISTDNLELYFTRAMGSPQTGFDFGLYTATRETVSDPWENVNRIENITGEFLEAPSISFDGKLLYYHQKIGSRFKIYVVDRQ